MPTQQQINAMNYTKQQIAAGKPVSASTNPFGPNAQSVTIPPPVSPTQPTSYKNMAQPQQGQVQPPTSSPISPPSQGPGAANTYTSGQNLTPDIKPWQKSDYSFNADYVPTDEQDPVFSQVTDPYQKARLTTNMANAKGAGIDTSKLPMSASDEAQQIFDKNKKDKTYLDEQIDEATRNSRNATMQSQAVAGATIGAVNREGAQSTGNLAAAKDIIGKYGTDQKNLETTYQHQKEQLAQAQQSGNMEAVKALGNNIAQTQKAMLDSANQQMADAKNLLSQGGLTNMSDEDLIATSQQTGISLPVLKAMSQVQSQQFQKGALGNAASAQDMFLQNVAAGAQITPEFVQTTAQSLGIPADKLQAQVSQYNTAALQIKNMKGLDEQTKSTMLAQEKEKLNDQINGLTTAQGQNIKAYQAMVKAGNVPKEAMEAFRRATGLEGENDPMFKAKLKFEQANATIADKHSRGEPVTPDDYINQSKAIQDALENGMDPAEMGLTGGNNNSSGSQDNAWNTGYLPSKPVAGFKAEIKNGVLNVTAGINPRNGQAKWQCGEGVNRTWGLYAGGKDGMPSEYSGKKTLVDKHGINTDDITDPNTQIVPGMAFVMPIGGKYAGTGHTGLVKQNLGNGNFLTAEWNADGKEGYSEVTRNISQMYGFANPPGGSAQKVTAQGAPKPSSKLNLVQVNNMSSDDLISGLQNGTIDLNQSSKVLAQIKNVVGPDNFKALQDQMIMGGGNKTAKTTNDDVDSAAKALLDGRSFPTGKLKQQIINRALQLDTSGNFDPTSAEIDYKSKTGNAESFGKLKVAAEASLSLFDKLKQQQAKALEDLHTRGGVGETFGWLQGGGGKQGVENAKNVAEKYGFTGFKMPEATLADLKGQIGLVAANGNAPQNETLHSLAEALDVTQTPEQFAASLEGIKQAMKEKEDFVKESQAGGKKYGTYEGQKNGGDQEQSNGNNFFDALIKAGKGTSLVHDAHTKTGKYTLPEDHPINNYSF